MTNREAARFIVENTEHIVRRWVAALRSTPQTEVHNEMLTAEIVGGTKALLVHVAGALEIDDGPDQGFDRQSIQYLKSAQPEVRASSLGTRPLMSPTARALQSASALGRLRHEQGYDMHEVMLEQVLLKDSIRQSLQEAQQTLPAGSSGAELTTFARLERIMDDVALAVVESYHEASVRDLETRALRDPLTGLYNKDYFGQRLQEEMRRALRYSEPMTLVMMDMDHLKAINDTHGHQAGDVVLVSLSAAIADTCRRSDIACRYGGDEFTVILPEITKAQGRAFGERLLRALARSSALVPPSTANSPGNQGDRQPGAWTTGHLPVIVPVPSVSIGLASFPEDGRNPEMLIAKADAALYRAKSAGRNTISF